MSYRRPRIFMMDLLATVPYYTAYLSKALLADGADVTVGSISYYLDKDCFTSRGINIDPGFMDLIGRLSLPRLPRRVLKLLESLVNLLALTARFLFSPPDVIHVQFLPMLKWRLPLDMWFVLFCRARGARIVLTVHDLLPHDSGDAYRRTFFKLYQTVDRVICHSDHVKERLLTEFSVPATKVDVIPHGPFFYDLPETGKKETLSLFELEDGAVMVLWQGIIFPYKGVDLLLRAWKQVEATGSNATLMIVGTGSQELLAGIREEILKNNLRRVELIARFISAQELVALYRAAQVVVYPYRAITTSGALATGLALGKAIVASDLPVFRELLTDRVNALLVDPEDTNALSKALLELILDSELREKYASQIRAMDFGDQSWLTIARKTIACYEAVL